jgi:hypothetical protein
MLAVWASNYDRIPIWAVQHVCRPPPVSHSTFFTLPPFCALPATKGTLFQRVTRLCSTATTAWTDYPPFNCERPDAAVVQLFER